MESAPSWARRATPGTPSSAGAPLSPRVASMSSRCWTTLRPAHPSSSGCSWRSSGWPGSTVRTELPSGGWCAPTAKTQPLCCHCDRPGRRPWALSLCCFLSGKAALLCGHHTSQRRLGGQRFHGSIQLSGNSLGHRPGGPTGAHPRSRERSSRESTAHGEEVERQPTPALSLQKPG